MAWDDSFVSAGLPVTRLTKLGGVAWTQSRLRRPKKRLGLRRLTTTVAAPVSFTAAAGDANRIGLSAGDKRSREDW